MPMLLVPNSGKDRFYSLLQQHTHVLTIGCFLSYKQWTPLRVNFPEVKDC